MQIFSKVSGDFTCEVFGWPLCSRPSQETEPHRKGLPREHFCKKNTCLMMPEEDAGNRKALHKTVKYL